MPIGLHGRDLYHRCLHDAARCLIAAQCVWLHFLSWSSGICSRPGSTPVRPRCASPPAAACVSSDRSPGAIHTVETEATDVHYCICWVLKPPDFEGLASGGAAQLIKDTTCKRVIRPFCLMVISCWAIFDGNLCADYSAVRWTQCHLITPAARNMGWIINAREVSDHIRDSTQSGTWNQV